jgi:heme-degrading monooxygenase HmoA
MALKPGVDANSEDFEAVEKTALTAVSQPGAQRVYWGQGVEDPSNVWLFLDWNSVDDHLAFQKSE